MRLLNAIVTLFLLHLHLSLTTAAKHEKVRLSDVRSLTLRGDRKTTHRRVSAIPQLRCVGGNARGLYDVDVLRCTNEGASYGGDQDVQWTCTASLPSEFRLGATDVKCEGYASADDPYILKGSCGIEYRLMLTQRGEERYGRRRERPGDGAKRGETLSTVEWMLFWALFAGVLVWILYNACSRAGENAQRRPRRPGGGGGGGYGSGGGGGGGPYDDPPPPYDYSTKPSQSSAAPGWGAAGGWQPGFWTGAAGGAAAGYAASNWRNQRNDRYREDSRLFDNGGEGGSRTTRSSASSGSGYSASRHESTGFGSTSRR